MDSNTIAEQTVTGARATAQRLAAAAALVDSHGRRMMTTALGVWEDESSLSAACVGSGEHPLALLSPAARP